MTAWEEVEEEFACEHTEREVRYKVDSLGRKQYIEQCLMCGEAVSSPIRHSDLDNKHLISAFDTDLLNQREALKHARWQDKTSEQNYLHQTHKSDWFQYIYTPYVNSPEWQDRRQRVLERDGHLCQACRKRRANQVHHMSYKHFGHEPLFELVSVCKPCHDELTEEGDNGQYHAEVSPILSH